MIEVIKTYQLDIMLVLGCMCGMIAVFLLLSRGLPLKRKRILIIMELSSMILLLSDRLAYIYRGNTDVIGYWMVRVTNFLVFLMIVYLLHIFNLYLEDLIVNECGSEDVPKILRAGNVLASIGMALVVISQFTGFYYTFDDYNRYQRAAGFPICYAIPIIMIAIQIPTIIKYGKMLSKKIYISLLLFVFIPIVASIGQFFFYGVSLTNIAMVGMSILLYLFALDDMSLTVERANRLEIAYLQEEQQSMQRLFKQVSTAFVNAIDGKDEKTRGHSLRVADYSKKIAEKSGFDEKECEEIYYAALLHDVGKLSISDSILTKRGELDEKEKEIIRQTPIMGQQILSGITEFPYISEGAHYHNERYDGKGYPDRLKGDEIPRAARIITVADSYDTMISGSSYRKPMPKQLVREELVKGVGTQFDPKFAEIMLAMIDTGDSVLKDSRLADARASWKNEVECGEYRRAVSAGVNLSQHISEVVFKSLPDGTGREDYSVPSLILYDSLDGQVHNTEEGIINNKYLEYGEIWFDGRFVCTSARDMQSFDMEDVDYETRSMVLSEEGVYKIEAVKYNDHVRIRLYSGEKSVEIIAALPDSSREAFISLTGEHCFISGITITRSEEEIGEGEIKRIAEEVSYIDKLVGDMPNIQVNGARSEYSEGTEIVDGMRISFHSMSLPTANLVWHCPYVLLYYSDDGKIGGHNYKEYAVIRLNGELQKGIKNAVNKIEFEKTDSFGDWNEWKEKNKKGYSCVIGFHKLGNRITTTTSNCGLIVTNVTTITDGNKKIYAALTGDRCALTNIRII
ncbi:MAG: HD-GYP domain-containing protein [Eubacterium sp.]|nr:HD-GYP domain-containing protein [Eubacterium sp.]